MNETDEFLELLILIDRFGVSNNFDIADALAKDQKEKYLSKLYRAINEDPNLNSTREVMITNLRPLQEKIGHDNDFEKLYDLIKNAPEKTIEEIIKKSPLA